MGVEWGGEGGGFSLVPRGLLTLEESQQTRASLTNSTPLQHLRFVLCRPGKEVPISTEQENSREVVRIMH